MASRNVLSVINSSSIVALRPRCPAASTRVGCQFRCQHKSEIVCHYLRLAVYERADNRPQPSARVRSERRQNPDSPLRSPASSCVRPWWSSTWSSWLSLAEDAALAETRSNLIPCASRTGGAKEPSTWPPCPYVRARQSLRSSHEYSVPMPHTALVPRSSSTQITVSGAMAQSSITL
jgi:hypothetical protein